MTGEKRPVKPADNSTVATSTAPAPADLRVEVSGQVDERHLYARFSFDSPLPPAEELERLKAVDERIVPVLLDSLKAEIEHRQRHETTYLTSQIRLTARGQVFGFTIALMSVVGGLTLVGLGHSAAGLGAMFTGIAARLLVLPSGEPSRRRRETTRTATTRASPSRLLRCLRVIESGLCGPMDTCSHIYEETLRDAADQMDAALRPSS